MGQCDVFLIGPLLALLEFPILTIRCNNNSKDLNGVVYDCATSRKASKSIGLHLSNKNYRLEISLKGYNTMIVKYSSMPFVALLPRQSRPGSFIM